MEFKYEKMKSGDMNYINMEFSEAGVIYGIGVEENTPIKEVIFKLERQIKKEIENLKYKKK